MEQQYKTLNGISFHLNTPDEVCRVLSDLIRSRKRVRLYWGDVKTGKCWNDEYDIIGSIGNSTGINKIPLLIKTQRSSGGGAVLDNCLLKIKELETGRVLYQAANWQQPVVEIVPTDMPKEGYTHNVNINGELHGRCKSERSAKLLKNKMS